MTDFAALRESMIERQIRGRGIARRAVLEAFRQVPREAFVPEHLRQAAYEDGPLPIGEAQTISQPYIVALMIDAAGVSPGDRVLEVGAGSGYAAALLGHIAGEVVAVERHARLARAAAERLDRLGCGKVSIVCGDGTLGMPERAPFDAILVAASGETVPAPLKRQLAIGGRLVMPVGSETVQSLLRIIREAEEQWDERELGGVRFVPLVGAHGRWDERAGGRRYRSGS